jgi:glycosyltransferase involved in cell wall biosynthesis
MNIVFFSTYYTPYTSGLTTYAHTLLEHLSHHHHITILTFRHNPSVSPTEIQFNQKIIRMPYFFKISKGFISPQSLYYFWKYVIQADVILLNLPNFEGFPLAILSRLLGKKVTSIFHCRVFLPPGPLNRIISTALDASVFLQMALSHHIIIYTKDYFNSLTWEKRFTHKTIEIPPPVKKLPVDTNYLKKLKQTVPTPHIIGFAGRISQEKGLEYLIQAITLLPHPSQYTLLLAGPYGQDVVGEQSYVNKIETLLKTHNLNHNFLGKLTGGKLGAFYKAIDVLVLPSINQTEAYGMVQIDAMLQGTPVIASDLPGVRIPVTKSGLGLIVPITKPQKIAVAITTIIPNKHQYIHTSNQEFSFYFDYVTILQSLERAIIN